MCRISACFRFGVKKSWPFRRALRPDFARHRIRLTANEVGLSIQVDQQTFDTVSDIPDPQIRALIQDAIREWEGS